MNLQRLAIAGVFVASGALALTGEGGSVPVVTHPLAAHRAAAAAKVAPGVSSQAQALVVASAAPEDVVPAGVMRARTLRAPAATVRNGSAAVARLEADPAPAAKLQLASASAGSARRGSGGWPVSRTPTEPNDEIVLASKPPAEFEEMLKPQRTVVDVYFGNEKLGSTLAEYTPETIEFIAPQDVVNWIPNVVSRNALSYHLEGPQPRNSDLLCRVPPTPDCGKLTPDFIGVIFDETRFRVDLFVHPDMLMVAPQTVNRNLPAPDDAGLSLVQNINAVLSRSETGDSHHTVTGLTYAAKGMQRVYSNWSSTDSESFQANELAWQRDTHDYEYTAGLFDSHVNAMSFAPNEYLVGAGFGRSLKTRTDLDYSQGTEIQLFLTSRSQVDIYKDNVLLSTKMYSAGNVKLDTSRLPGGAYDIEIRIREVGGDTRVLHRFFVKSNRLAPLGEPLYYVEAGQIVRRQAGETLPQDAGAYEVRGTYQRRVSDAFGFSAGGAATDTHALFEGGPTFLRPTWDVSALFGVTTQGDYGTSLGAQARFHELGVGLFYRNTRVADPTRGARDYQLMTNQDSNASLSLAFPAWGGQVQLGAERSSNYSGNGETYTSRYLRPLDLFGLSGASLSAELSNYDGVLYANLALTVTQSAPHRTLGGSLGGASRRDNGASDTSATGQVSLNWRDEQWRPEDIEATLRASRDLDATVGGLDGLYASQYGRLEATAESVEADTGISGNRLSASYDTNFLVNANGVSFGGRELAPSAVVLDLGDSDTGAEFDVLVDGMPVTSVRGGHRVVLPLSAYRTYNIQLVDRGLVFVAFDGGTRKVTTYPGTVQTLSWTIKPVKVAIGRFMLNEHVCSKIDEACYDLRIPMKNAMIHGASGFGMTDEDGRFQIEMIEGTKELSATRKSLDCHAALPEQPESVNGILKLGELECRATIDKSGTVIIGSPHAAEGATAPAAAQPPADQAAGVQPAADAAPATPSP